MTKINPQGSALVYSNYLGGTNDDWGIGISVDSSGGAYVIGYTAPPVSLHCPATLELNAVN